METETKNMLITGRAKWAKVHQVDMQFPDLRGGGRWSINIIVDKDNEETIKNTTIGGASLFGRIKTDKDGDRVITFEREEIKKDGSKNKPPSVIDSQKHPTLELIGNGSLVNVSVFIRRGPKMEYPKGYLNTVQVLELVTFSKSADPYREFPVVEDGYKAPAFESQASLSGEDEGDVVPFDMDKQAASL